MTLGLEALFLLERTPLVEKFVRAIVDWLLLSVNMPLLLGMLGNLTREIANANGAAKIEVNNMIVNNRVESALTEPTLSHHGTCDVAYRGFKLAFNKTKNFALLGLGCYSMP
ncbi:MAG: hypothetical protein GY821_01970, partial [Gammaproteobacteria bacterium]|nr:hypothetical protein [Gammaproteobacteria bacterium]